MRLIDRRSFVAGGGALLTAYATRAYAQAKPKLRFSCAFSETDLRAEGYKALAAAMKDDFDLEPYWSNSYSSKARSWSRFSGKISNSATLRPPTYQNKFRLGR